MKLERQAAEYDRYCPSPPPVLLDVTCELAQPHLFLANRPWGVPFQILYCYATRMRTTLEDEECRMPKFGYFSKMSGTTESPPMVSYSEIAWSWIGAFLGIAAVSYFNFDLLENSDLVMLIGSFGASAVLIYGAIKSPLAQPRNLVGGHIFSAIIGVTCYKLFPSQAWLASSLAVSTAIAVMHATKTLHPPGGATALIAVIGSSKIHSLGYLYAIVPAGLGAVIMLVVALLVNNLPKSRRYPDFWI